MSTPSPVSDVAPLEDAAGTQAGDAGKHRVVSNILIMGSGQVVTWVISMLHLILVSRYLGPGRAGELGLAGSVIAVLGLVMGLGMGTLITRTVARTPERAGPLTSAAIAVQCLLAVPILAILVAYAQLAHLNDETRLAAYILAISMVAGSIGGVLGATFQGREQMSLPTISGVITNALDLVLAILFIKLGLGVVAFASIGTIIALVMLAVNMRWIRRYARLSLRVSRADMREVALGGLSFWVNGVFLTIYMYIDSIILFSLAGSHSVGIYGPAMRMLSVAFFVPTIVGAATLPLLSRLGIDAASDFGRVGRKTLSLLITCAIPLTIGLATFARPLVLTVFGQQYAESVPALVAISLCIPPSFVAVQAYQLLVARNQQWRWTWIMAAGCLVNPLINLVLIRVTMHYQHNGAIGAALSLVITESCMGIYGLIILRDIVFTREFGRVVAGTLAAGAAQGAVLWATAALWSPLSEALGVAAFAAVALVLGVLSREDAALLWETSGRAARGLHARVQLRSAPMDS